MLTLPSDTPGAPGYRIAVAASICHEASRELLAQFGDTSLKAWGDAEPWQREGAIKGVEFLIANPTAGPSASHEAWACQKIADGWKFGPVKDAEKKEHPCLVSFDKLPVRQQLNDQLFVGIVRALMTEGVPAIPNEEPRTKNQELPAPSVRIHLLNRKWGYGATEGRLQGYSGRVWGPPTASSRFSVKYGCHFIDLSLAEYEEAREDLGKGATLSGRLWEVVVVVDDAPPKSATPPKPGEGEPSEDPFQPARVEILRAAGIQNADTLPPAVVAKVADGLINAVTADLSLPDITKAKLPELRAIAAAEGIDLKGVKNEASARKRIREARAAKAEQPAEPAKKAA